MGLPVKTPVFTLNGVDRSEFVESITPNRSLEVLESRAFDKTSVVKDAGLFNNGFTVKFNDKAGLTMLTALEALVGTKVTFSYKVASAGSTAWNGTCLVLPPNAPLDQGQLLGWDHEFPVDGDVTFTP